MLAAFAGFSARGEDPPPGQELVALSAKRLRELPSIDARIRQRIDLFGRQLVGSGTYQQLTDAEHPLVRLELKLQVGDQVASLQQVCDGRFLWVRREMVDDRSLTRVDLRRLHDSLARSGDSGASLIAGRFGSGLGSGGLSQLMASLDQNFEFGPARFEILNDLPVWGTTGRWKPHALASMLPNHKEEILAGKFSTDSLPAHLPQAVNLVLGRDSRLPLFPYRIEFLRDAGGGGEGKDSSPRLTPMVTVELFEVRRRDDLDPRHFAYEPGDQEVVDNTEIWLHRLGASPTNPIR